MPDIFAYDDYRKFIADLYEENKARDGKFSYLYYSQKAGFKSKSYLHEVVAGKKKLSRNAASSVGKALGLAGTELSFFQCLVAMNQATDEDKQAFFDRLGAIKTSKSGAAKAKRLRQDQFEYYSTWYHPVVRALLDMVEFKHDYRWLAKAVYPAITVPLAKKSVQLLERLGLVERTKNGTCRVTEQVVTTGREVLGLAVKRYHADMMDLGKRALQTLPATKRNVSGLTLGISEKSYTRICDIIYQCQDSILAVARDDQEPDRVVQVNFHAFPVSMRQTNRRAS